MAASLPSYKVNFTDFFTGSFTIQPFTNNGTISPTIGSPLDPFALGANTSLVLYGKGSPNYGERTDENLINILESFYGSTEPAHAINGQLWFASIGYWLDTITMTLYRFVESSQTWTAIPPGDFAVGFVDPIGDPGAGEKYAFNDTPGNKTLFFWYTEFSKWLPRLYTARTVAPVNGTDFADKELIVCDDISVTSPQTGEGFSAKWRRVLKVNNSIVPPTNPTPGELWYDPSLPQLNTWNGLAWVSVADRYVLKAGDTMTGFLFLNADPTLPLHAATKQYVDAQILAGGADGVVLSGVLNPGGTLQLNMSAAAPTDPVLITGFAEAVHTHPASVITFAPSGFLSATDVQAALVELDTEKAPKASPTFTGVSTFSGNAVFSVGATVSGSNTILLGRDPLLPLEAATKDYVDDSIASIVGTDSTQLVSRTVRVSTGLANYTGLPEFTVYSNMLSIYVNGVKQLNNVRGEQRAGLFGTPDLNDPSGLQVDPIINAVAGGPFTGFFVISNDFTTLYAAGATVEVRNSTGNDGLYTVSVGGSTYAIGPNETTIPVDEAVPSSTPPFGDISPVYRATITIDGGAPLFITVPGFDALVYVDVIDEINNDMSGGIAAFTPLAIRVVSDSSGPLSSVSLADGTPPLFASLADFTSFLTAIPGVSYAYDEDGSTFNPSTSITFESGSEPIVGSIIEFIISSVEETIPGGDDLTAIEALNTNGILTRIASNTWAARTIVTGSTKIAITNGNGVAGNPSVDLGIVNLDHLGDVVIALPVLNEVLTFDGVNWVNSPSAGGGGTPGGLNTQVQYNDGGFFGGDADFTFDETTSTLAINGIISNAVGTAALPSYTFTGDLDTGMYQEAAFPNTISFAISGAEKIRFSSAGVTVFSGFFSPGANTPATPEFSFTNDPDTGMFRSAADTIDFTTGGISRMSIGSTGITFTTPLNLGSNTLTANTFVGAQGGAATPSFTFNGDTDTGLYTATPDNLFVGTGATRRWTWDANGNAVIQAGPIATSATDGFLYISTMPGTPTGIPTSYAGRAPIVLDTTNNKLYGYDGAWIDLTGTGGGTPGGSNTYVQYNDGGVFGGDADFTFDETTNTLSVAVLSVAGDIVVGDEVRFLEPGGPSYVGFRAGSLAGNTIWRLPLIDGTSGELLSTDGAGNLTFITATGTGTVTSIDVDPPAAGITVSPPGPITTAGTFTLALADDLAALEGLTTTGIAVRVAGSMWATRTIIAGSSNIVVTNGSGVAGDPSINLGSIVNTNTFVGAQTGASAPSFTFNTDTDTGLYTATPDNLFVGTGGARRWTWDALGNAAIQAGGTPLLTTATDGFLYISAMPGVPTGIPSALATFSGRAPIVLDTLNNRLYGYDPVDAMWLNLTGSGGGTPGGANTQVQFNDSGVFGGDPDFTWTSGTNTLAIGGVISNAIGTAALPSYTFTGDLDTGIFRSAIDTLGFAAGGISVATMSATGVSAGAFTIPPGGKFISPAGGVPGAPNFTFTGDLDTGIFNFAPDAVGISGGGIIAAIFSPGGIFAGPGGSAAAPSIAFSGDTNTGLYSSAADNLYVGTGGIRRYQWDSSGNAVIFAGGAALATTATAGFVYISTMAGVPTGIPTSHSGRAPIVLDTSNNRLYGYDPVDSVWLNLTTSGSGIPGGADTNIQFNDGGSFGGDADFTWNKTTNTLTIVGSGTLAMQDATLSRPHLKDYSEERSTPSGAGPTLTINLEDGNTAEVTLTANITSVIVSNPPISGRAGNFTLVTRQDATGGRTITWSSIYKFAGGTDPVLTATPLAIDVFTFITMDGGATWLGFTAGLNFS